MVAAESELERLTALGETAWIDQEWAASFFEMQFHMTEAMKVCVCAVAPVALLLPTAVLSNMGGWVSVGVACFCTAVDCSVDDV